MIDCIREVGADSVIQVITDSAAVYKAAGRLVEQKFSWITWTPCTPHCLAYSLKMWGSCHGLQSGCRGKGSGSIHHKSPPESGAISREVCAGSAEAGGHAFCHQLHHAGPHARGERGVVRAGCRPRVEGVE